MYEYELVNVEPVYTIRHGVIDDFPVPSQLLHGTPWPGKELGTLG